MLTDKRKKYKNIYIKKGGNSKKRCKRNLIGPRLLRAIISMLHINNIMITIPCKKIQEILIFN